MKRKRYSEEQTVSILNEREAGRLGGRPGLQARRRRAAGPPLEVAVRRHDGARPQAAQASSKENLRLKRQGRGPGPRPCGCSRTSSKCQKSGDARRQEEGGGGLRKARPASERRTCRLLGLHRSTARSRPEPERGDGPLADRLRELARRRPRYGYLTLHHMLKREGLVVNRKRTHRVYARLGLQVRAKRRRRLWRPRVRMAMPTRPNERWSIDFMSGQLASGRRFRILNVADDFSRPCVGQLVATSITGARLALFLDELGKAAAPPKAVVCDNGPEPASKAMRFWSERSGAAPDFIQPGKPTMSAFVESFNGKFRDSCLTRHWFRGIADVRRIVDDWRHHYNHERPHSSLGYSTPAERAKQAVPFYSLSNWTCFRGRVINLTLSTEIR